MEDAGECGGGEKSAMLLNTASCADPHFVAKQFFVLLALSNKGNLCLRLARSSRFSHTAFACYDASHFSCSRLRTPATSSAAVESSLFKRKSFSEEIPPCINDPAASVRIRVRLVLPFILSFNTLRLRPIFLLGQTHNHSTIYNWSPPRGEVSRHPPPLFSVQQVNNY